LKLALGEQYCAFQMLSVLIKVQPDSENFDPTDSRTLGVKKTLTCLAAISHGSAANKNTMDERVLTQRFVSRKSDSYSCGYDR
jgi:hypothetical protein